jgi:hypothetical protein
MKHFSSTTFPDQAESRKAPDVYATFENVRALPASSYMPSLGRRATSLFTHDPTEAEKWASYIPAWASGYRPPAP